MKNISRSTSTSKQKPVVAENPILQYMERRHETLREAMRLTRRYFAIEGIHDLRVEIKKIRAILKLMEELKPGFESKPMLRKLRRLFRIAGDMRDIDIEQDIIQKEIIRLDLSELINFLKQQELSGRRKLKDVCDNFDKRILSRNLKQLRQSLGDGSVAALRGPMNLILKKHADDLIVVAGKNKPTNDDLHAIRKSSKSLRYEVDVWQHCFGTSRTTASIRNKLTAVYDNLGQWRDVMITVTTLDSFLKNKATMPLFDKNSYIRFRQVLEFQKQHLLSEFEKAWRTLLPELKKIDRLSQLKREHIGINKSVARMRKG